MEKLSRAAKYKEYRSELLNDSEKGITTDELKGLQQRLIEVEKKFGNTSKTEADMSRGHKSLTVESDAYDIFNDQSVLAPHPIHQPNESQIQIQSIEQPIEPVFKQVPPQQENANPLIKPVDNQKEENIQNVVLKEENDIDNQNDNSKEDLEVEKAKIKEELKAAVKEEIKAAMKDEIKQEVKEEFKQEVKEEFKQEVKDELKENEAVKEQTSNIDVENLLKGLLSKNAKENDTVDYLEQIKKLLTPNDSERKDEPEAKQEKSNVNDALKQIFRNDEPSAPDFGAEPEYIPTPKSDTDSIPSVEHLIDEINSVVTKDEEKKEEEVRKTVVQITPKVEEKEVAEFAEEEKDAIEEKESSKQIVESVLKEIKLEKPVIKPLVPKEDNSKEFSDLCEGVNKLAQEIETGVSFAGNQYIPPRPELPKINSSLDSLKNNIQSDINSDPEMNSFMDNLKKEVNIYNQSVENVTLDELKDNIVEDQRHKEPVVEESHTEENKELKQEFEYTVNTEVSKILDEINASKTDVISTDDVINNADSFATEIPDIQQGKTIAFETGDVEQNSVSQENTIVLSNPYSEENNFNDSAIHTMSFETEELYEDEEKGSTALNIVLIVLIILAILALVSIGYFFLLTRGII